MSRGKLNNLDPEWLKEESELATAALVAANDSLIACDYAEFNAYMKEVLYHRNRSMGKLRYLCGNKASLKSFILTASGNLPVWWNIWRWLLSEVGAKSIESLSETQFVEICDMLYFTCRSLTSRVIFVTWILSDGRDIIKFPMKPKFNAVRNDHMLTPRVSFSQIASCKLFENYSKEELFDELFSSNKLPTNKHQFLVIRSLFCDFVTSWKPHVKPARSDRTTGYYVTDGDRVYFIFNRKSPKDTNVDWRVWICPDNDTWLDLQKQYNLEEPKQYTVKTIRDTYTGIDGTAQELIWIYFED